MSRSVRSARTRGESRVFSGPQQPRLASRVRTRGSTLVECTFILLIFLGLLFLLMDLGWSLFVKATLQHAVRAGLRYAITNQQQTQTDPDTHQQVTLGQVDSIKQVIQRQSMGLLSGSDLGTYVHVDFYQPSGGAPTAVTGVGSNNGGNLVIVSIQGFPVSPMAPLLRSTKAVPVTVQAGDLLEPQPSGPPPL